MAIRTDQDKLFTSIEKNTRDSISPGSTVYIDDVLAHTGPFYAVLALADAVVDASECTTNIIENNAGTMQAVATNFTIPKGVIIYGNFTSIELDSGSVMAYARDGITVTAASS